MLMNVKGKINSKLILFFLFILLIILALGIVIFLRHKSTIILGIKIIKGPSFIIAILSLIFSILPLVISIWFMYLLFNGSFKNFYNKTIELKIIDLVLLFIILISFLIALILITIGFTQWDNLVTISNK